MNFIGNPQAVNYFQTIIDRIIATNSIDHGFLLLCGPQYIGKMTLIESVITKLVGDTALQDLMKIQDFSDQRLELKESNDKLTGSSHSIKIAWDDTKTAVKLPDGTIYHDFGAREMISWLAKSPAGQRKVLIIENIERLGIGAANALLKTFEEPLEDRLIICTCSHPNELLPTITSRAVLINFYPVPAQEIEQWLHSLTGVWIDAVKSVAHLSMGRPWLAKRLLEYPKYHSLLELVEKIDSDYLWSELLSVKHSMFMKLHEVGLLELALDMLQIKFVDNPIRSQKFLQTRQYLDSNVSVGTIMMNMLIP